MLYMAINAYTKGIVSRSAGKHLTPRISPLMTHYTQCFLVFPYLLRHTHTVNRSNSVPTLFRQELVSALFGPKPVLYCRGKALTQRLIFICACNTFHFLVSRHMPFWICVYIFSRLSYRQGQSFGEWTRPPIWYTSSAGPTNGLWLVPQSGLSSSSFCFLLFSISMSLIQGILYS